MFYLNDEALELTQGLQGKNTLVNQLIIDHFSNDEEILESKMDSLTRERDMIKSKLTGIRETKMKAKTLKERQEALTKESREYKAKIDKLKKDWQDGKISDKEYWKNFKN